MKNFLIILVIVPLFGIAQSPQEIDKLRKLAIVEEDDESAIKLAEKYIQKGKNHALIYFYKAVSEYGLNLYSDCERTLDQGISKVKLQDTLYRNMMHMKSWSQVYTGNIHGGIHTIEELTNQFPSELIYFIDLSIFYGENMQYYNCLKALKKAYEIDSSNMVVINNLAYYNTQFEDYNSAKYYANIGLKMDLKNDSLIAGSLYNSLGISQARLDSPSKGLATIMESMKFLPQNPYAYYNIGLIYLDQKNIEEACRNFKISEQLGGTNQSAATLKTYCE